MKHLLALVALFVLAFGPGRALADEIDAGNLAVARLIDTSTPVSGVVFLLSDAGGWSAADDGLADALAGQHAIVVGIDLPATLKTLAASTDDCVYLVSGIEQVSQQLQRKAGTANLHHPIVAGRGYGGGLALAIAAQTPAATIGHTVALDPSAGVALQKPLCSEAPREVTPDGTVYGLQDEDLPDPIDVLVSGAAPVDGVDHVKSLIGEGFSIALSSVGDGPAAFGAMLGALLAQPGPAPAATHAKAQATALDVPLVELPATPRYDSMAIVYSGDGGWRDLDKSVAEHFQEQGLPSIGVDSLRYFWSEKSPRRIADDLMRIIDIYSAKWGVHSVALVGYSFGADVIPAAYNLLDSDHQAMISQISLLGFAPETEFEVSVAGWLGTHASDAVPTMPELKKIELSKVQCVYGEDEGDDTACPQLQGSDAEVIRTTGGHHFDGDYDALADKLISGLRRRNRS